MIPEVLIYPVAVLWALGLFLVLFRRGIYWGWKAGALVLLVFFAVWYREPLLVGHASFRDHFGATLIAVLTAASQEAGRSLHLLWPLVVFLAFFGASDRGAGTALKAMVLAGVFFWLFFFLFKSLPAGWEHQVESRLPEHVQLPHLPYPPAADPGKGPIRP